MYLILKNHEGTELFVPVEIISEKRVFDRQMFLISPIGGAGEWWVNADRVISGPTEGPANV